MKGLPSAILGVLALVATASLPSGRAEACSLGFLVFFDERSTDMSDRGVQVMEEFARFYRNRRPPTETERGGGCAPLPPGDWRVVLFAHADDPGAEDQCAISVARGYAVRARLAALGIPETSIVVQAFGDRRQLIPTQPGTWDHQNRRVEFYAVLGERVEEGSPYPRLRGRPEGACPEQQHGR